MSLLIRANFDHFDEVAFALPDPSTDSGSGPEVMTSASPTAGDNAVEDLFATANAADSIDASTDLFGTADSLTADDLFGSSNTSTTVSDGDKPSPHNTDWWNAR